MDLEFEARWRKVVSSLSDSFGEELDLPAILVLIGAQELENAQRRFNKQDKVDLMHVAICTLLSRYGYYTLNGYDNDGWPHFELNEKLPALSKIEQERLLKKAIMEYSEETT